MSVKMIRVRFLPVYRHFPAIHLNAVGKPPRADHLCDIKTTINMKTLLALHFIHFIINAAAQVQHILHLSGHLMK
jgi:hypothetical protein